MPTFNKVFKEVGIVPISIICFMVNRHKEGERRFLWGEDSNLIFFVFQCLTQDLYFCFSWCLGALVVKEVFIFRRS